MAGVILKVTVGVALKLSVIVKTDPVYGKHWIWAPKYTTELYPVGAVILLYSGPVGVIWMV